jgi:hypothetical protein
MRGENLSYQLRKLAKRTLRGNVQVITFTCKMLKTQRVDQAKDPDEDCCIAMGFPYPMTIHLKATEIRTSWHVSCNPPHLVLRAGHLRVITACSVHKSCHLFSRKTQ